jgi:hypothetical protein
MWVLHKLTTDHKGICQETPKLCLQINLGPNENAALKIITSHLHPTPGGGGGGISVEIQL